MQNDPEKVANNYNEIRSLSHPDTPPKGIFEIQANDTEIEYWQDIMHTGIELVESKIAEILGGDNRITHDRLTLPSLRIIQTHPENPNLSGFFSPSENEITLIMDSIDNDSLSRMKVFIHEYLHFLSHNGRDDYEWAGGTNSLAQRNNVGFRRNYGIDIRAGKEGQLTSDYFSSFNEAVTEQLAIDILPGPHMTYEDYRGLLNQAVRDAVMEKIGSKDASGRVRPWTIDQMRNYVYRCFFKGDLAGFTNLLQMTYAKYELSEQQFGLMTNKADLPSMIKKSIADQAPALPPPNPAKVKILIQQRLDRKTSADYMTDIVDDGPDDFRKEQIRYGLEYDTFVETKDIIPTNSSVTVEGVHYPVDSQGLVIYRGEGAASRLSHIRSVLDDLLETAEQQGASSVRVSQEIDRLLFDTYRISMLSEGFREFFVYKHTRM